MMYLLTIFATLLCIQWITIASSEPTDLSSSEQLKLILQSDAAYNNENLINSDSASDEENDQMRRSGTFLRFGRGISPSSGTFLRFGRGISSSSGSFLRFGRSHPAFLRFGRGGSNGAAFLRFGRRAQIHSPNNIHRFARKGEFLRFG